MLVCENYKSNVRVEDDVDDDDDFEQPRVYEDPISEKLSDGKGVEDEDKVNFDNPNPLPHLDESEMHDGDSFIHDYLNSFEVMSKMFFEGQM